MLTPKSLVSKGKYFIGLYGGKATNTDFQELAAFEYRDFVDSSLFVLSFGKELSGTFYKDLFHLEVEGQLAKHWGYQNHSEINTVVSFRWKKFPWDSFIDTSFALGDGLSYATEDPRMEIDEMGRTSKILNYLMLEWAFSTFNSKWSVFCRIHHRSGIYGLINNVSGGSNILTGGIRYTY